MPFFRRKKKEVERSAGPLPEFPRLPEEKEEPKFPVFEPEFKPLRGQLPETREIKEHISFTKTGELRPASDELGIPLRKRPIALMNVIPEETELPEPMPPRAPITGMEEREVPAEEKPLFVKIDKYRDAMNTINLIKNRLREAEEILNKINEIRNEEERELSIWHQSINTIKEKLIYVDEKLFEV